MGYIKSPGQKHFCDVGSGGESMFCRGDAVNAALHYVQSVIQSNLSVLLHIYSIDQLEIFFQTNYTKGLGSKQRRRLFVPKEDDQDQLKSKINWVEAVQMKGGRHMSLGELHKALLERRCSRRILSFPVV